jgi:hypothetical protein
MITLKLIALAIIMFLATWNDAQAPMPPAPDCWEDEVVVQVVDDPYGDLEGTLGCVPADDLPTTGYRP